MREAGFQETFDPTTVDVERFEADAEFFEHGFATGNDGDVARDPAPVGRIRVGPLEELELADEHRRLDHLAGINPSSVAALAVSGYHSICECRAITSCENTMS